MDVVLSFLTVSQLDFVEDQLSNSEFLSDDELLDEFIECGLTENQARQALTYRERYLSNVYRIGYTPIRNPGVVLRYNPHRCDFEAE
ncbi:hypothetical protein [Burkholderia cepacia]|uniref:hypothetical protein n=1 Tax=Burkholderia cepacia TaxID=292 RepID=UPI002AB6DD4C|nr:hypothetical protein [Burkholderia cepacia]